MEKNFENFHWRVPLPLAAKNGRPRPSFLLRNEVVFDGRHGVEGNDESFHNQLVSASRTCGWAVVGQIHPKVWLGYGFGLGQAEGNWRPGRGRQWGRNCPNPNPV